MDRTSIPRIRKIIVGPNQRSDAFVYEVDKSYKTSDGDIKITEIVRDENSFFLFGSIRYIVYGKTKSGDDKPWKTFENIPISVECFV